MFNIPNYQLVAKGKYCSNHGILLTYVHKNFYCENFAINNVTTVWENLFIKIRHKTPGSKTQIIGNIYRKPNELLHDFHKFQEEFDETLELLRVNRIPVHVLHYYIMYGNIYNIYIYIYNIYNIQSKCGDFNIDLLKLNVKDHYNTFFNNLIAAGYFPRISLPTRITNHSATLLDNITELDSNESGILVNNISDHQMIYTYNTTQRKSTFTSRKKMIEVETNNRQAIDRFLYSSNLKKNWQIINESLNRRKGKRDFPQEFHLANGTLISEPKQIANAFNDFFISVGDTGQINAAVDFNQYMPAKPNCNLTFQPITVDITSRIIDSLKPKTSTEVDCISNKLLKFV